MSNLKDIIKKKIIENFLNNTDQSTHYDFELDKKVRILAETIDFKTQTAKAEIVSGKERGQIILVNLDNIINLKEARMVFEDESNYPPGAEFDPNAPYNQPEDPEIKKYTINYTDQKFEVELMSGQSFELDFIDVLEDYWKKTPGSFERNNQEFGHLDTEMDSAVIKKLREENYDFSDSIMSIAETKNLF